MSNAQKVKSNEQKETSKEQKVTNNEQKVTSNVQKLTSNKQKLTSNEQKLRGTSNEQNVSRHIISTREHYEKVMNIERNVFNYYVKCLRVLCNIKS